MNSKEQVVKELTFDNYIWIIFIAIALLNIYADVLMKDSTLYNDEKKGKQAKDIFLLVIIITIIIYLYFLDRNYNDYQNNKNGIYEIRLLGSIFLVVGSCCFLYFQLKTRNNTESLSNI